MEGIMMVAISARYLTYFNTSIFVLDYAWLSQESSNNANSNMYKLKNWQLLKSFDEKFTQIFVQII